MSQLTLFDVLTHQVNPKESLTLQNSAGDVDCRLMLGDCLTRMKELPDSSIDAIITDPPYFKVKKDEWDNQWGDDTGFLNWLESVAKEWHRVLKSNGSLYCFCGPRLTSKTELLLSKYFNVLNVIRWNKPKGYSRAYGSNIEGLRGFFGDHESIIFCEHYGADNAAKGEAGYISECDKLRGFVFEPLRKYFVDEMKRAGLIREGVRAFFANRLGTKGKISGHFYDRSQWILPTEEHYNWLRELHNQSNKGEYLRREYEELRRPFFATPERPFTATWTFDTVRPRKGKHPCEKPLPLIEHILLTSTRPDAVVLDSFAGSFNTGLACCNLNRNFIGIEMDANYFEIGKQRMLEAGGKVTEL